MPTFIASAGYSAERPHRERRLLAALDAERARAVPRGHGLCELRVDEVQADAVVGREAGRQLAPVDEATIGRAPPLLAVVVRTIASWQEAEALERRELDPERVGHAGLEPADRAGAHSREHDPTLPGLAEDPVDAVDAPDREHVRRVPAADVDDVLGEQEVTDVQPRPPEQLEMRRLGALSERLVEADDVVGGVAARRGQEADAGPLADGEPEHEVVEHRVAVVRKPAASERHDVPF